ncbi:MAG: ZIP family metal transporter [Candidatus Buchananbacteria bacterium]|nr:ZIP family metal transporter [Candidatus Buchananbacteria bacterium]
MTPFIYALIAAFAVSLLAFIGLLTLALKDKLLKSILIYLVSFSAGGLMGGAFFHLLPESIEEGTEPLMVFIYVIIGFCVFFLVERFLRWHHCHERECKNPLHLGYINLIGDGVHNFIDGVIIVTSYMVNIELGVAVTISIIFHEIPQELGDFGVLIYSGISKTKALFYNFLTALLAILGVIIGYLLLSWIEGINAFLIPVAAGGFIYIAATDLIPELQKVIKLKHSILTFVIFCLALILMLGLKIFSH